MGKLENRLDKLELKVQEIEKVVREHKHCKKCKKIIYGITNGEDERDLEVRNPLYKYNLCEKCAIKIIEKQEDKQL